MRKFIVIAMGLQVLLSYAASNSDNEFSFILRRIVNPATQLFSGGGTNNLVHFSCVTDKGSCHGFLAAGAEHDGIDLPIPVGQKEMAILLSIAKNRFQVCQKNGQSRSLVVREYEKGCDGVRQDHEVSIGNLPTELSGAYPVVLQVEHGAKFSCKSVQAVISKRCVSAPTTPIVIHSPPQQQAINTGSLDGSLSYGSPPSYAAPLLSQQQQFSYAQNSLPSAPKK